MTNLEVIDRSSITVSSFDFSGCEFADDYKRAELTIPIIVTGKQIGRAHV